VTAWRAAGVTLSRTSQGLATAGVPISRAQISAGDLIIYYGGAHVGVAIDNNSVVHAPTPGQTVKISPINSMPIYAIRHIG
jgi:cell wall-associated NlpC family hydrolase